MSSKKKKITRTTVLSPPVESPSDVKKPKPAVQVATDVSVTGQACDGTPYRSHGYVLLRFRGNVVMKMGTPQQHNNQDSSDFNERNAPLYLKKLNTWAWENAIHHHTKRFDLSRKGTLVVRRGQPFKFTLTFNRPYNPLTDELKFFFETGDSPKSGNDTMICLTSYTSQGSSGWKSDFLPVTGTKAPDGLSADLWIFTPADCIVSDWKFSVQSIYKEEMNTGMVSYEHPERIYILFNPWDKKDTVHYPTERLLEEYVMNPSGLIFFGTKKQKIVKPWIYGQFEEGVLEACICILKKAFTSRISQAMGDPLTVSRNLCSFINGKDNSGVIEGRWSTNDFTGGRSPTIWSGSVSILLQYANNVREAKGGSPQPVKYGQCYVFAAVVTTVCRALGIPCRCVTNYNSGLNLNRCLSVDLSYQFDEKGEDILKDPSDAAIWNFHVWNDVWMRRPGLKSPLNQATWHVIDSTPQRFGIDGLQCCGPAHLSAVKAGLTDVEYDVDVIYSEVNADVSHWLKLNDDEWTPITADISTIGEHLSTKSPDGRPARLTHKYTATITDIELSRMRQDITTEYKRRDVTRQENRHHEYRQRRPLHLCDTKDIKIRFSDKDFIYVGEVFYVTVHLENTSSETRTVQVFLYCESIHYNGQRESVLKKKNITRILEPQSEDGVQLKLKESNYIDCLAESYCLRQFVFMKVEETDQVECMFEDFILQKPHLELEPKEKVTMETNFELKLKFKNPLQRSLTQCSVCVEGTGIESMLYIRNFEDIPAECEWTGIVNLMPLKTKSIQLSVTFHCKELFDVTGACAFSVKNKAKIETEKDMIKEEESGEIDITGLSITENP